MELELKSAILWFWGFVTGKISISAFKKNYLYSCWKDISDEMLKNFTLFYSEMFKLLIYWGEHWCIKFLYCELKKIKTLISMCSANCYIPQVHKFGIYMKLWYNNKAMIYDIYFLSNNIIWTAFFENTQKLVENVKTNCNSYTNVCTTSKTE